MLTVELLISKRTVAYTTFSSEEGSSALLSPQKHFYKPLPTTAAALPPPLSLQVRKYQKHLRH